MQSQLLPLTQKGLSVSVKPATILQDEDGAALVEFALVMTAFFLLLFGGLEMSNMYYQWNAATKAMQFGARLAAVSGPAASTLTAYTGLTNGLQPGDPLPANAYDSTCTANTSASAVTCTGGFTGSSTAFRRIVFGDPSRTACAATPSAETVGMCNYFGRLMANNVSIRYQYTGLGYAGRPGGPVPTVTVSLRNLQYSFVVLNNLMVVAPINIPAFPTTVTGEDLNTAWTAS